MKVPSTFSPLKNPKMQTQSYIQKFCTRNNHQKYITYKYCKYCSHKEKRVLILILIKRNVRKSNNDTDERSFEICRRGGTQVEKFKKIIVSKKKYSINQSGDRTMS